MRLDSNNVDTTIKIDDKYDVYKNACTKSTPVYIRMYIVTSM